MSIHQLPLIFRVAIALSCSNVLSTAFEKRVYVRLFEAKTAGQAVMRELSTGYEAVDSGSGKHQSLAHVVNGQQIVGRPGRTLLYLTHSAVYRL